MRAGDIVISHMNRPGKGTADEIANMILFLLSDKATYMTGHSFVVDGGWTAK